MEKICGIHHSVPHQYLQPSMFEPTPQASKISVIHAVTDLLKREMEPFNKTYALPSNLPLDAQGRPQFITHADHGIVTRQRYSFVTNQNSKFKVLSNQSLGPVSYK